MLPVVANEMNIQSFALAGKPGPCKGSPRFPTSQLHILATSHGAGRHHVGFDSVGRRQGCWRWRGKLRGLRLKKETPLRRGGAAVDRTGPVTLRYCSAAAVARRPPRAVPQRAPPPQEAKPAHGEATVSQESETSPRGASRHRPLAVRFRDPLSPLPTKGRGGLQLRLEASMLNSHLPRPRPVSLATIQLYCSRVISFQSARDNRNSRFQVQVLAWSPLALHMQGRRRPMEKRTAEQGSARAQGALAALFGMLKLNRECRRFCAYTA